MMLDLEFWVDSFYGGWRSHLPLLRTLPTMSSRGGPLAWNYYFHVRYIHGFSHLFDHRWGLYPRWHFGCVSARFSLIASQFAGICVRISSGRSDRRLLCFTFVEESFPLTALRPSSYAGIRNSSKIRLHWWLRLWRLRRRLWNCLLMLYKGTVTVITYPIFFVIHSGESLPFIIPHNCRKFIRIVGSSKPTSLLIYRLRCRVHIRFSGESRLMLSVHKIFILWLILRHPHFSLPVRGSDSPPFSGNIVNTERIWTTKLLICRNRSHSLIFLSGTEHLRFNSKCSFRTDNLSFHSVYVKYWPWVLLILQLLGQWGAIILFWRFCLVNLVLVGIVWLLLHKYI